MADDEKVIEALNLKMGEGREELAKLVQDLKGDEGRLEQARMRYSELKDVLVGKEHKIREKQRKAFALKMELEGVNRAKKTARRPTGSQEPISLEANDKRGYPRLPFTLHVNFGGLKNFYSGVAVNISDGGMLVATCDPPAVGKRFAVEFELDSERTIRAPVEAMWVDRPAEVDDMGYAVCGVGLRFLELSPEDRAAVSEFREAHVKVWEELNL